MANIRILGIPGSLRTGSFNRRLLECARENAPPNVTLEVYTALHEVPLFNEDLEGPDFAPPAGVARLREAIGRADAVLIATPEYNQSMPGVLKNAIDWLSRPPGSAFDGLAVALVGITVGEWGTRLSQAALRQTLYACGAELIQVPHVYLRRAAAIWDEEKGFEASVSDALSAQLRAVHDQIVRNSTVLEESATAA